MIYPQLLDYIRQQRAAGVPKDSIKQALVASGWTTPEIEDTFNAFENVPKAPLTPPPFTPPASAPITKPILTHSPIMTGEHVQTATVTARSARKRSHAPWIVSGILAIVILAGAGVAFADPSLRSTIVSAFQNMINGSGIAALTRGAPRDQSQRLAPDSSTGTSVIDTTQSSASSSLQTSCPPSDVSLGQGARTQEEGLAAFQTMLTLIADKQGESKAAHDASVAVNIANLSVCQIQLLVTAIVKGGDSVWASTILGIVPALSLSASEKQSLTQVVGHSHDELAAFLTLAKEGATLSSLDRQALEAVLIQGKNSQQIGAILISLSPTIPDSERQGLVNALVSSNDSTIAAAVLKKATGLSAAQKQALQAVGANQTTALSTYTNTQYGFTLQYPSDLSILTEASQSNARLYPAFVDPSTPATTLFVATDIKTGGHVIVGESTDPTQVANCLIAPKSDSGGAGISGFGNVVLNGTTFFGYQSAVAVFGIIIEEHDYRLLRGNACIAIREVPPGDVSTIIALLKGQSGLTAAQQSMLQQSVEVQAAAPHISAELDAIVQSFRLTH